jgi:hypothetical protein
LMAWGGGCEHQVWGKTKTRPPLLKATIKAHHSAAAEWHIMLPPSSKKNTKKTNRHHNKNIDTGKRHVPRYTCGCRRRAPGPPCPPGARTPPEFVFFFYWCG